MPDEQHPNPVPQPQIVYLPSPAPTDREGRILEAAKTVMGLTPQAMQNLILVALAIIVGLLIYFERVDRRDADTKRGAERTEQIQMILRSSETQGELNRQAILSLAAQIGRLEQVVTSLDRTVSTIPAAVKGAKPPEEGEQVTAPMPRLKGFGS